MRLSDGKNRLRSLAALLAMSAVPAAAAEVRLQISSRDTQVGVPVTLRVVIEGADDGSPPALPDIPNLKVRARGGPMRQSQMSIVNGAVQSSTTLTYDFELTPTKEGAFTIPSFEVTAGGQKHPTQPITLTVSKSETNDLLFVEIKGDRSRLYVGESLQLTLQIWLRPFTDRAYGKLNEPSMWSCISDATDWGGFRETLEKMAAQRTAPKGREVRRKDSQGQERGYYLYEISRTTQVNKPGQLSAEDINVVVSYPTGVARSNDLFSMGMLRLTGAVPISGQARISPIEVLPVPAEGRPAWYSNAVGRYTISTSAKPTDVAVGDPITLTLVVNGSGNLDELQPPPLAALPELNADFRVPADPLAGEVTTDGKRFSISIRASSDSVQQIPPIPFAFFDPQLEKFVTVRSEPIPLQVKPAEKLAVSQIVDSTGNRPATAARLTESTGGILANYTGMDEVLRNQEVTLGTATTLALIVPPLAFAATWLGRRRSERLRTDVGFARGRRARREAVARLKPAEKAELRDTAAAVCSALSQYVADRCNVPGGGMTRAAVVESLRARGVRPEVVGQVDELLDECEAIHYGGGGNRVSGDLLHSAMGCIDRLEREKMG